LDLMEVDQPSTMTQKSLLLKQWNNLSFFYFQVCS
jgi:hypothetical protein